jgi:inner membrane transporter RhtA
MARLARATYALFVSLLPAVATVIGVVVLGQLPSALELGGIALVMAGVALHEAPAETERVAAPRLCFRHRDWRSHELELRRHRSS